MKKKALIILAFILSIAFVNGTAIAIPYNGAMDGSTGASVLENYSSRYTWVDSAYWTLTDLTTAVGGSSLFEIRVEQAAYESDFGLFYVDDISTPTIKDHFQIFSYNNDEQGLERSVYFKTIGSDWYVTLSNDPKNAQDEEWTPWNDIFGFYYGIHTGGASDISVDYIYYSDWSLNTEDPGDQHVAIEWDGVENIRIHLEDLRTENADWDWKDMSISGHDLQPVPEPATMLLLGTGLIGLAGAGRKKLFKK